MMLCAGKVQYRWSRLTSNVRPHEMPSVHPSLVFAFVEDGTLRLFPSREVAAVEFEGIDVESGTVHFYDSMGRHLKPHFLAPNRVTKLFGPIGSVVSGTYELVPSEAPDEDTFAVAMHETQALEPNTWFRTLDDLKEELRKTGVQIEYVPRPRPSEA